MVSLYVDRGPGPSARSNHVAALYDDKLLLIFGGTSKSRTLNDLYSFDFETVCKDMSLSTFCSQIKETPFSSLASDTSV